MFKKNCQLFVHIEHQVTQHVSERNVKYQSSNPYCLWCCGWDTEYFLTIFSKRKTNICNNQGYNEYDLKDGCSFNGTQNFDGVFFLGLQLYLYLLESNKQSNYYWISNCWNSIPPKKLYCRVLVLEEYLRDVVLRI